MKLKTLAPWKKSYDKLRQPIKSRNITFQTKAHIVKVMPLPVVMYTCESWTIKKAENWRIDAFELWCWRRLLRVPWTARRSNQSILKEISPEYSFEGLRLKLKVHYFSHLMWRADSLEKTPMLGKIEGRRRRRAAKNEMVGWHYGLNGHKCEQISEDSEEQESPGALQVPGDAKSQRHLSDWTNSTHLVYIFPWGMCVILLCTESHPSPHEDTQEGSTHTC